MDLRIRNRNKLLIIGAWFLALGNIWHWFALRIVHLSDGVIDGGFGLMMGIGFGSLLLSLWRHRSSNCSQDPA